MNIHKITTGCVLVEKDGIGILNGCASEVVKFLANLGLSPIKIVAIVLSDTSHFRGISNWAVEFPIYKALFMDGGLASGQRLVIVGTEEQIARIRELIRITLFGPSNSEYRGWSRDKGIPQFRYKAMQQATAAFRLRTDSGRAYELDELVSFVTFGEDRKAVAGPFVVTKGAKDSFVIENSLGERATVALTFQTRPAAPFKFAPAHEVHRPLRLGVRVLTYGNGFDPASGCTALVVWLNGIPVLWDAAPFVSEALAVYGLSVDQMGGIFLTHVHDDHASLLEFKELGRKVKIFTTLEVWESALIKMCALLGCEKEDLLPHFEFVQIHADKPTTIYGVDVLLHDCVHSIPTWGATFVVTHGTDKKKLLLTGDTVGPRKLRSLIEKDLVSSKWGERMLALPKGDEALVIMDGGADPAELHPNPMNDPDLRTLAEKMGERLRFGHRATKPADCAPFNLVKPGDLLVVDEGNADYNDFGSFRQALAKLGIEDEFEARALFSQGDIRTETFGKVLVREGEEPDYFYAILYGTIAIKNGDTKIAHLNGGSFFGEMAILTNGKRNATAETVSAVRLLAIPRDAFARFAEAHKLLPKLQKLWTKRNLLTQVQLFRSLPAAALAEVAEVATEVSFDAGVTIVMQGSTTDDFYVIVDGEVEVEYNGQIVAILEKQNVFGEIAALLAEPRSASVRSKSAVKLLKLRGDDLRQLATTSISVSYSLRMLISERRNG